jgi:hypothetical protein
MIKVVNIPGRAEVSVFMSCDHSLQLISRAKLHDASINILIRYLKRIRLAIGVWPLETTTAGNAKALTERLMYSNQLDHDPTLLPSPKLRKQKSLHWNC